MSFQWYREIANQMETVGDENFPQTLHESLFKALPYDLIMMVVFRKAGEPHFIHHNFPAGRAQRALETYAKSTFVLDPFFQAFVNGIQPGVYLMDDLAPDAYFEGEFFRQYNVVVNQMEQSGFLTKDWPEGLTELGIFAELGDGNYAVISLYRQSQMPAFDQATVQRLAMLFPVVQAMLRHHYKAVLKSQLDSQNQGDTSDNLVQEVFSSFGKPTLSERESQIMQLVLKGHSTESIGYQLNISPKTVKTHRRNCYAKLRISSQAELLNLFLESLTEKM